MEEEIVDCFSRYFESDVLECRRCIDKELCSELVEKSKLLLLRATSPGTYPLVPPRRRNIVRHPRS